MKTSLTPVSPSATVARRASKITKVTALTPLSIISTGNRFATPDEQYDAHHALLNLGEDVLAKMIKLGQALDANNATVNDPYCPLVVTDFSNVGEHKVLLVPHGVHEVPVKLLQSGCFFIGMSGGGKPTLILVDVESTDVVNRDNSESTTICVADCVTSKFLKVRLDAPAPTVLEVFRGNMSQFSDLFFGVDFSSNVDALSIEFYAFYKGHSWALKAYGEQSCRSRNPLEVSLDGLHTGVINTIDNIFRPLVAIGYKLDALLGLK